MGDALREQGKKPSKLELTLNAEGMHGFLPPGLDIFDVELIFDCKAQAETSDASSGAVVLASIMQNEAVQAASDRWGTVDAAQAVQVQGISGDFCSPSCIPGRRGNRKGGSVPLTVPLTLGRSLTFHDDIVKKVIECKDEAEIFENLR